MDLAEPEPGAALRLHVAFRVSRRTNPNHRVDLLSYYGHLIDCRNNSLLDSVTSLSTPGRTAPQSVPSVKVIAGGTPTDRFLEEFLELTKPTGIHREVRHNTTHHTRTTPGPPVACRPRRLALERLAVAKAEFDAIMRDGTARRADGPRCPPPPITQKRTAAGDPAETTELSTLAPFQTGIQYLIYRTIPTALLAASPFPKSTS